MMFMNSPILLFWVAWIAIVSLARYIYRNNINNPNLLIEDKRIFQRFVVKPLYLLGESYDKNRRRARDSDLPPSILPPRYTSRTIRIPEERAIEVPADAKLVIHNPGHANRCEVCHQADRFNSATGLCERCKHR